MKFFIENWFLFVAALRLGRPAAVADARPAAAAAGKVSAAEAVRLINRERAVLIDVSEPAEYAAGHAAGARNVPLASLETSRELPKNKALPLVVVCPTGARAPRGVAMLEARLRERAGARRRSRAWRDANLPVEKTA